MTTQQNNSLINLMLNGKYVSHFSVDNNEIMAYVFDKKFYWIYFDINGEISKKISE